MQVADIATFIVLSIASGRVAYSITTDTIFRPLRHAVYRRSAPHGDSFFVADGDGDRDLPARLVHRRRTGIGAEHIAQLDLFYAPGAAARTPGFLGSLFECPFCMSFWTSMVAAVAWLVLGNDVIYPALPIALWAAANTYAVKAL